jgi:hypothetical protein
MRATFVRSCRRVDLGWGSVQFKGALEIKLRLHGVYFKGALKIKLRLQDFSSIGCRKAGA